MLRACKVTGWRDKMKINLTKNDRYQGRMYTERPAIVKISFLVLLVQSQASSFGFRERLTVSEITSAFLKTLRLDSKLSSTDVVVVSAT